MVLFFEGCDTLKGVPGAIEKKNCSFQHICDALKGTRDSLI